MNFFELVPLITYNNEYEVRNIFYKYYIKDKITNEYLYSYRISEGETLESIAYGQYNDSSYWWLLALLNDIRDPIWEIPLSENVIQTMARDQAIGLSESGVLFMSDYIPIYDELTRENDEKRIIKIIKPEYINKVVSDIIRSSKDNV